MHPSAAELDNVAIGLGFYYLLLAVLNWGTALLLWRRGPQKTYYPLTLRKPKFNQVGFLPIPWFTGEPIFRGPGLLNWMTWFGVGSIFLVLSPLAFIGMPPALWDGAKGLINTLSGPVTLTLGSLLALSILFIARRYFVRPAVAWTIFNVALLLMGMSITDPNFRAIVTKPDNVPIVALVFLLGYFTWLAAYRAVINDDRRREGLGPAEKDDGEKILVWPDLVYTEMICMVAITALLIVWGIALQAPLEEPASSVKTPNPSKAPWYFLGLQEMLVYYDPWMAGVVLPSLVILGLMAIPFLDFNKGGNGYYTIEERKFSYITFQLGFLELWVVLIVLGTFLRGPNWNFFGPFEFWDAHKVLAQNNVDLSQYFWIHGLGRSMPKAPADSNLAVQLGYIAFREAPGILLVLGYLLVLPPLFAMTIFRKFYVKMGFIRYMLMINLMLMMVALPLKMLARWTFNLKYFISIPEYFLNL